MWKCIVLSGCEIWETDQPEQLQTKCILYLADGNYTQKRVGNCKSTEIRLDTNLSQLWDFLEDIREMLRNNQMIKDNDTIFKGINIKLLEKKK
jgi:hypothetical protein